MTVVDLSKGWRHFGMSHFGLAWIAMAFTCGPHHLEHGLHILSGDRGAGPLELFAVVVGFPAGVTWFLLRCEAMLGGRGDRIVRGDAPLVRALPAMSGVYVVAFAALAFATLLSPDQLPPMLASNLLLVVLYSMIGW